MSGPASERENGKCSVSEVGGRFSTLVEAGEFCERDACAGADLAKGRLLLQSCLPCR